MNNTPITKLHVSIINIREMLTDTFKAIVNNPFKESFYRNKKKKKTINVSITFFILKVVSKLS